jgi:hypothetical protein
MEVIISGEPVYYARTLDSEFRELILLPISDVHYGNPLFSKHHLLREIRFISETPNAYTILNGDLCESALRTSKGEIYRQVGTPQDQRDWIIEKFYPIRDKILGMTLGNHEARILNDVGIDICQDIAKALGVPYRAAGMFNKISFGDGNNRVAGKPYVYWTYFTHGYGGARTSSAKAIKVERTSTFLHADLYGMSHDHLANIAPSNYLIPDNRTHKEKDKDGNETGFTVGKVTNHRKMLVKTNAYMKWGGYSETFGYPPVDLESPVIRFQGEGKRRVKVEI